MPIPISATRNVRAVGATYLYPASNLVDGDDSTLADIYLTAGNQDDWFLLDLGAPTLVGVVTLKDCTANANPVAVWVSNTPALHPDNPPAAGDDAQGCTLAGANPLPAGSDYVFAVPDPTKSYRYLKVRQGLIGSSSSSALIGGVSYSLAGSVPAPTLTATPALPGNVPSVILQGM